MARLKELTWGPKGVFDWLQTPIDPADFVDGRPNYAGDYTNKQAYELALLWGIDDKKRVQTALEMVEVANRLSAELNIPLKDALRLTLEAQSTDPLCIQITKMRQAWTRFVAALQSIPSKLQRQV